MENTNTENFEQVTQAPQAPVKDLTIADLNQIKTVFDVAVRRGAFVAQEMSSVGALYDKLDAFLTELAKNNEKQSET